MIGELLPAEPRVLAGYTHILMAQLSVDAGLSPERALHHLKKTAGQESYPDWLKFRQAVLYRESGEPEAALRLFTELEDSDGEVAFQSALCWMAIGAYQTASHAVMDALALSTEPEPEHFILLAEACLESDGDVGAATAVYELFLKEHELYQARASAFEVAGDHEQAIIELNIALTYLPDEPVILAQRALNRYNLGDFEGASRDYTAALGRRQESLFLAGRALADIELGRTNSASRDAELAFALDPAEPEAMRALATVFDFRGNLGASARFWDRYTIASGDLQGLLFQAEVLNRMERPNECDALVERYRKQSPECWEGKYYEMAFLRTREHHEAAELMARDVLGQHPGQYTLLFERAENLLAWGKYSEAAEQCLELLKLFPDDAAGNILFVEALVEGGQHSHALAVVEKLEAEGQTMAGRMRFLQAESLCKTGRWEEALPLLDELVESDPKNPDYYEERSHTLYELDRFEDSIRDADKVLEMDPNRSWIRICRAFLNLHRGDLEASADDAAFALDKELVYQHRLLCRGVWVGAKLGHRIRGAISSLSRFFRRE